ncbi:MAG: hypothetical protein ACTHMC_28455 [Pseudobacter sp.]|uniref:hypothetical protein n=1 Tax=Pseudobacter sp. TaxID=2045420 RepID=UPI003F803042
MKTKILFLNLLFFACVQALAAQEHNTNCMHCAYYVSKASSNPDAPRANNECGCAPCSKKKQQEKQAKQLEQKKLDEQNALRQKAEQEAKRLAFEEKKRKEREEASKPKSGELLINDQRAIPSQPESVNPEFAKAAAKMNKEQVEKMSSAQVMERMNEIFQLCPSYQSFVRKIFLDQKITGNQFYYNNVPESVEGDRHGSYSKTYPNVPWEKIVKIRVSNISEHTAVITADFSEKLPIAYQEITILKSVINREFKEDFIPFIMAMEFKEVFARYIKRLQTLAQN